MPEMAGPQQYHDAAADCRGLAGVIEADVFDRDPRVQRPVLERVPPRVLRTVAEHDLGVRTVTPQGTDGHFVAEVV